MSRKKSSRRLLPANWPSRYGGTGLQRSEGRVFVRWRLSRLENTMHLTMWDYSQVVAQGRQTSMSEARHSIAGLIEALQDGDFQIRNEAAVALGELGPEASESVPALTRALEAEDKYLRSHAAAALGKIGPAAGTAVPALTRALKDKDEDVRGDAAAALGHIGVQAR